MSEEKLEFYEMIINADKTHDVNYKEISKELLRAYKDLEYSYLNLWEEEKELVEKIDKANEILNKGCFEYDNCPDSVINEIIELKEILGDKEIEEIPQFKGTLEQLDNLTILGEKENE